MVNIDKYMYVLDWDFIKNKTVSISSDMYILISTYIELSIPLYVDLQGLVFTTNPGQYFTCVGKIEYKN